MDGIEANSASASFDHLVGAHKNRFRDGDPEILRDLEVDDQFESRGTLDREVSGFGAVQDAANVNAATPKHIRKVRTIGDEAARVYVGAVKIHREQTGLRGEISDVRAVGECERIR